jgi:predicted PurR-regulated permease PerM
MRAELGNWIVRGAGLATGLAIVYGVVQLGVAAAGVLVLLFLAVLLAAALEPIVGALRARLPVGRGWSVLIVYAAFVLLVAGFALLVVPAAAAQADAVLSSLPAFFVETRAWASELRPAVLASSAETVIQSAQKLVGPAAQPDADLLIEVGGTAAEVAIHVATLLGLVFFWIVEHARLQRYALAFLPAERRTGARDVWNEIEDRLGGWVRGQLILMGVIGVSTGIAYSRCSSSRRSRNAFTVRSSSAHSRLTSLLLMPSMPRVRTRASTLRVETPRTYASATTAYSARSERRRGSSSQSGK